MTSRLLAVSALLCAAGLQAQPYKSLTSVTTFKVASGKEAAFVEKAKPFLAPLDKLMASGVVLAYGIDTDMLHVPGESNVAIWAVVPNYDAAQKEGDAIQAFIKANPGLMADLAGLTDMAAHHDFIMRSNEEKHRAVPAGAMPVGDFDVQKVKPGRMQDFMGLFRRYDQPVLDKLLADGVIYGYSVDTEAVHTGSPGTVWSIVTMPDLGTKDKVNAAFAAAQEKLPEAERNITEKLYYDMVEPGSHRDSLSVSVVFKSK